MPDDYEIFDLGDVRLQSGVGRADLPAALLPSSGLSLAAFASLLSLRPSGASCA